MSARERDAEVIRLAFDIPGIAQAGDAIIHHPNHPNPALRLCLAHPLDISLLPEIRAKVAAYNTALSGLITSTDGRMPGA